MANFLSVSPNQTMFLPSVCLIPARLFCHSCFNLCSLFKKVNNCYTLVFKVAKWAVSSLTHSSNPFHVNMFISRFMIQILHNIRNVQEEKRHQKKDTSNLSFQIFGEKFPTSEFWMISEETPCWEKERNSQIFNVDFCLPLYLPLWFTASHLANRIHLAHMVLWLRGARTVLFAPISFS